MIDESAQNKLADRIIAGLVEVDELSEDDKEVVRFHVKVFYEGFNGGYEDALWDYAVKR